MVIYGGFGFAANRHRDGSNEGPSVIRSFGQFEKGGELLYWPADDGTRPVDRLCCEDKVVMDVGQGFALLDGRRAHEVTPFEGGRCSLAFRGVGEVLAGSLPTCAPPSSDGSDGCH